MFEWCPIPVLLAKDSRAGGLLAPSPGHIKATQANVTESAQTPVLFGTRVKDNDSGETFRIK